MRRTISSLKNVEIPWSRFASAFRRNGHGGTPWARTSEMSQPQDGALGTQARITEINTRLNTGTMEVISFLDEPEDAQITGGTRSLSRRLTGLNIMPRRALTAKPVQSVLPVASQSQVA
ncbi:hypothetical protein [Granulicella mallensis]|uniref:Uncharacterized protein n=1 Tax=Granulicella mallensis (strain ATCC BAA-1857 / DSM 23137 / MP5ACTX8) TaxID=682795 RepID=G8NTA4_GRAMM|nr:hypothetical protein [Granulicella mallensis]AEU38616.1 hypothetical protein AciX8_4343 [Granulicella mallensis MP5ACTX8]